MLCCIPGPGVARQRLTLLLLRQKKVSKEKATRSLGPYASLRAPCGARAKRGLARTRCAQTIASPFPLDAPLLSPARTGGGRIRIRMRAQWRYVFSSCLRNFFHGWRLKRFKNIPITPAILFQRISSGNSSVNLRFSYPLIFKLHHVSKIFYTCINVPYIRCQPNPHEALGGI